ncbi:MAG: VWA domain-containing protein [Steroidobacteraceae bacterium]|nr:VWA domain-containing protein [Steroidobacteraceae bacterium]
MSFEWPQLLWAALLVPMLGFGFARLQRRRLATMRTAARAGRQPGADGPRRGAAALPAASRVRALVPPALYGLALLALVAAAARPIAVVSLPSMRDVIILALDVSNSMRAEDLKPSRLAAAKQAAREFIEAQPATTRIGLVAFAETALAVRRPTTDREELLKTLERLEPQRGTAVGEAIVASLQALFPREPFELPAAGESADGRARAGTGGARALPGAGASPDEAAAGGAGDATGAPASPALAPGSETSAAIVLLTDGAATRGPDPVEAARLAARRGVRVFTVGLGTADGAVVEEDGVSMRVQLDEQKLRQVADVTRARFFRAADADDLRAIYRDVSARLVLERRETEIGAGFVAFALLCTVVAAGTSLFWSKRIL